MLVRPPAAPSFPSCRKRRGRKGALGRVWCILRMLYRKEYDLQILRTHVPPYERYGTRRLLRSNWTCELVPLNGCGKSALRSKVAGQYGFAETPTMLIRGIINNYGLFQISRERSKKTEAVFLVALKGGSGGKSKSPRARFLLERQKEMMCCTCKCSKGFLPLINPSSTIKNALTPVILEQERFILSI